MKKKLPLLIIAAMLLLSIFFLENKSSVLAADYTEEIQIMDWEIRDSSGTPLSTSNPAMPYRQYQLWLSWKLEPPNGEKLKAGDTFYINLPRNQTTGSWTAANFDWDNFSDGNGVVLGKWRIYSNKIEVILSEEADEKISISCEFLTGASTLSNGTTTASTQNVSIGSITKVITFNRSTLNVLAKYDYKSANKTSNTFIRWRMDINNGGAKELSQPAWGTNFTVQNDVYIEDQLNESFGDNLTAYAHLQIPLNLSTGEASHSSYAMNIASEFTRVYPNSGDDYQTFKSSLQPFQYGVYVDSAGIETFVLYLGTVGQNGLKYTDLDADFAQNAANKAIGEGHYLNSERAALEQYFEATYGTSNVIEGHVAYFVIYFDETYPKVLEDTVKRNTMVVTKNNSSREASASGKLQGNSSSGGSTIVANKARVYLSDIDTGVLLPDVRYELQILQSSGWEAHSWSGGVTNDDGYLDTDTLGIGTYRFIQKSVKDGYNLAASANYDAALLTCVSAPFTVTSSDTTGHIVKLTNVRYKYKVTYSSGTQGDFGTDVHLNIPIHQATPAFSGAVDSNGKPKGKTGYTFNGWDKAVSPTVESDTEYIATWSANEYPITYELDEGVNDISNPAEYTYGIGVPSFAVPTKVGHTFIGWYTDNSFTSEAISISTTATGAVTLYAKWEANEYPIIYYLDGGVNDASNPAEYVYGIGVPDFADPVKADYDFIGWYDAEVNGKQVHQITAGEIGTKTLYARWKKSEREYLVGHYLERADGSYELKQIETYTAAIGEYVEASEKRYQGYEFNQIKSQPTKAGMVSADEQLILKLYYQRSGKNDVKPNPSIKPDHQGKDVATGDSANISRYIMMMLSSVLLVVFKIYKAKK